MLKMSCFIFNEALNKRFTINLVNLAFETINSVAVLEI